MTGVAAPQEQDAPARVWTVVVAIVMLAALGAAAAQGLPAGLIDTVWQLQSIQYMDDSETVPSDPARYTVRFGSDGSLQVRADCNRGAGTYTAAGASLTIPGFALTRALCPPGSVDGEYVRELSNVVSFVFDGTILALATAIDTSILSFVAEGEK